MRCKIILITSDHQTKRSFEDILSSSIEEGVELFIVDKKEEAEMLIRDEKPQLIFYDEGILFSNVSTDMIAIVSKKDKNGDKQLPKPIKPSQLLAFCQKAMNFSTSSILPPM